MLNIDLEKITSKSWTSLETQDTRELAEDDLNLYNVIIDILMVFRGRSCES